MSDIQVILSELIAKHGLKQVLVWIADICYLQAENAEHFQELVVHAFNGRIIYDISKSIETVPNVSGVPDVPNVPTD